MRRSSVDTMSPRSHCFSSPERSLAKPSASRCITAATSLSASLTVPRGSSTKPVCIVPHCDRNSPISDSENQGIDSEAASNHGRSKNGHDSRDHNQASSNVKLVRIDRGVNQFLWYLRSEERRVGEECRS